MDADSQEIQAILPGFEIQVDDLVFRKPSCAFYEQCLNLAAASNIDFQCLQCRKYQRGTRMIKPDIVGFCTLAFAIVHGILKWKEKDLTS
jgi:hypothetical protein